MSNSDIVRKISASKTLVHRMVIGDRENPKTVPQVVVQSPSPLDMLSKLYEEGIVEIKKKCPRNAKNLSYRS
uniref:Uncharacterized protein n=1 Tax=Caenorhabditis japonica TaxID=281687 RepID=A0A8R1ETV3_CAEJA